MFAAARNNLLHVAQVFCVHELYNSLVASTDAEKETTRLKFNVSCKSCWRWALRCMWRAEPGAPHVRAYRYGRSLCVVGCMTAHTTSFVREVDGLRGFSPDELSISVMRAAL